LKRVLGLTSELLMGSLNENPIRAINYTQTIDFTFAIRAFSISIFNTISSPFQLFE